MGGFGYYGNGAAGGFFCSVFVVAVAVLAIALRRPRRRCPRCAEVNPAHARFCAHCGTPLER